MEECDWRKGPAGNKNQWRLFLILQDGADFARGKGVGGFHSRTVDGIVGEGPRTNGKVLPGRTSWWASLLYKLLRDGLRRKRCGEGRREKRAGSGRYRGEERAPKVSRKELR